MSDSNVVTKFTSQGYLQEPGWVGRVIRLLLGTWCLYAVYEFTNGAKLILETGYPLNHWSTIVTLILAFALLPYVINIGCGLNSKRLSQFIVLGISTALFFFYYLMENKIQGLLINSFTLVWVSMYSHI